MGRKKNDEQETGATPGAPKETKEEKFRRLAQRRVTNALRTLRYVGNLGNRSQYSYTEEQAAHICQALAASMEMVAERFAGAKEQGDEFKLL